MLAHMVATRRAVKAAHEVEVAAIDFCDSQHEVTHALYEIDSLVNTGEAQFFSASEVKAIVTKIGEHTEHSLANALESFHKQQALLAHLTNELATSIRYEPKYFVPANTHQGQRTEFTPQMKDLITCIEYINQQNLGHLLNPLHNLGTFISGAPTEYPDA